LKLYPETAYEVYALIVPLNHMQHKHTRCRFVKLEFAGSTPGQVEFVKENVW